MDANGSPTRRRFLALAGAGTTTALAGCLGGDDGGGGPKYEEGDVDVPDDASSRSVEQTVAAQGSAETAVSDNVSTISGLEITTHEYAYRSGYKGSMVRGTVENAANTTLATVEVRVRVYNADDEQLGRYVDSTGDLSGDSTWDFEVILLESPSDIAGYDIAVLGLPA